MSYMNDYQDRDTRNKIPYDDIPITRSYSGGGRSRQKKSLSLSGYKILIVMVAFLFIANIAMCVTLINHMKNGKVKNVNIYNNEYSATEESMSSMALNNAKWSAVCVAAGGSCSNEYTFYTTTSSHGAGVIYRIEQDVVYFVTCYHVINGYSTDQLWVMLPSQLIPTKVDLVYYSSKYDVAVLEYKKKNVADDLDGCKAITVYDSTYLSLSETVYAVGNPFSGGFTISKGIVSQINSIVNVEGSQMREIQIDTPINSGNSGGGLFNAKGEFVGLVNAKLNSVQSGKLDADGIAFAIPANLVIGIAESIIQNRSKPTYIKLGVTFNHSEKLGITQEYVSYDGEIKPVERFYVEATSVKGIAYGKIHSGDIIEAIEIQVSIAGKVETIKVGMFNKYIFEDYSFMIVQNSEMKFYIQGQSEPVTIIASETDTY